MRIIGVLSWFEEPTAWLAECVASAARICDHLVAVDGAYGLFPGSTKKPFSNTDQIETIHRTAAGAGMGCTVHASRQVWWGGEVEKRNFMMTLATLNTTPRDWIFRIDADEVLTEVPWDIKERVAASELDVGEVTIWERGTEDVEESQAAFRCLFRAIPNLRVERAHYVVTGGDPTERIKILNGDSSAMQLEPADQFLDMKLEHRTRDRGPVRQRLKAEYAEAVERSGIEYIDPVW